MAAFVPSGDLEEELARSTEVKELIEDLLERAKPIAQDLAPKKTGDLQDGIEEEVQGEVGLGEDGFFGILKSTDFKGAWWEFGTSRHDAKPYLRPAVEALGLEVSASDGPLDL